MVLGGSTPGASFNFSFLRVAEFFQSFEHSWKISLNESRGANKQHVIELLMKSLSKVSIRISKALKNWLIIESIFIIKTDGLIGSKCWFRNEFRTFCILVIRELL